MTNEKTVIKTPELTARPANMEAWAKYWTKDEMVEVFNRYCDIKDREKKYRVSAAEQNKKIKAFLAEQGVDPRSL